MQLETRGGNLTSLDVKGKLDGGALLLAKVDQSSGERRLLVDSSDAGQVLKLVGFYPNMQGGRLRLEVDLNGTGPAEKTGTLWVENFKVLGDPIVSEVVSSADQGRPAIGGGRNVTREIFEFDKMRAPFGRVWAVRTGGVVCQRPCLARTCAARSTSRRSVSTSAAVPSARAERRAWRYSGAWPIISGAQGEGIFGITFAVGCDVESASHRRSVAARCAGSREMFQMTAANPRVQVRHNRAPQMPDEDRVRSSSSATDAGQGGGASKKAGKRRFFDGQVIDDTIGRTRSRSEFRQASKARASSCRAMSLMTPPAAASLDLRTALSLGNRLVIDFQTAASRICRRASLEAATRPASPNAVKTPSRRRGRRD